jgi:general secretion pathway protein C
MRVELSADLEVGGSPLGGCVNSVGRRAMKHRRLCDILVLTAVVYFVVNGISSVIQSKVGPNPADEPSPVKVASIRPTVFPPLEKYVVVSERNLFGGSGTEQAPADTLDLNKIPLAGKSLGLRLVGTVVTDVPKQSFALLENLTTRAQDVCREGDRVQQGVVKKIMRQAVIINTGTRDEMLTLLEQEGGPGRSAQPQRPLPPARLPSRMLPPGRPEAPSREQSSSISDFNQLIQEVELQPYLEDNKPAGFRVVDIKPESILAKMGLEDGDVIQGINGRQIGSPGDVAELSEAMDTSLQQGGPLAIEIKRGETKRKVLFDPARL